MEIIVKYAWYFKYWTLLHGTSPALTLAGLEDWRQFGKFKLASMRCYNLLLFNYFLLF
jgi:hypothetical protein